MCQSVFCVRPSQAFARFSDEGGSQWTSAVSSLTVARQRGLFTRFPRSTGIAPGRDHARTQFVKERKNAAPQI